MEEKEKDIRVLLSRIDQLFRQQKVLHDEIQTLQREVLKLHAGVEGQRVPFENKRPDGPAASENKVARYLNALTESRPENTSPPSPEKHKSALEEFIGTNLLNKVGIAVLVLGISFGAKYSIDHELVTPLTRIILGYLSGIVLIGIALKLKAQQASFSAVLLSGGMAVLYFITYAGYSFYGLIPQAAAFVMMVVFTAFTVFVSIWYDLEVIGIIGLVGAYAVPLLLSEGSGRVGILFTYITIINTGILFLSFRKYWKSLYYLAFILTWLTFASWYAFSFDRHSQAWTSMIFSTIFFVTFYATILSYKLLRKEALGWWDVVLMLLNSFIYFGYGYLTVDSLRNGYQYLGLFAVFTALIHFAACVLIYKTQAAFTDIFYFVAGMVLVFLTIAVPVQLEGNWVTLVWAAEAALLFWIGRRRGFTVYEKLSYPLIGLAFVSLLQDWNDHYPVFYSYTHDHETTPLIFLNVQFLTSMLVGAALGSAFLTSIQVKDSNLATAGPARLMFLQTVLPLLMLAVFYFGFYNEIDAYWARQYVGSGIETRGAGAAIYDQAIPDLKVLWLIIYSALFATLLCLLQSKWRNRSSGLVCMILNGAVLLVFMTAGIPSLTSLRTDFLSQDLAQYYDRGFGHILIRYVCVAAMAPLLWFNWKISRQPYFNDQIRKGENLFFHLVILVFVSSELIHWLDMARVENTFKLSLTILWGGYGLFLIVMGLSRDEKHIRVAGIALFALTLLKLFAYDMADMSTILKTVVMIILGALLLTASFIYNKYKRAAGNESD